MSIPVDFVGLNTLIAKKESKEKNIVFKELYKFNDFEELINAKKNNKIMIDLIVLATPSGYHAEQVIAAAKLGINVCTFPIISFITLDLNCSEVTYL